MVSSDFSSIAIQLGKRLSFARIAPTKGSSNTCCIVQAVTSQRFIGIRDLHRLKQVVMRTQDMIPPLRLAGKGFITIRVYALEAFAAVVRS